MEPEAIALFYHLVDRPAWQREQFYAQHRTPPAVRAEVESLFRFDRETVDSIHGFVAAAAESVLLDSPTHVAPPLTSLRTGTAFRGTERFTVRRQLGAGGMGVVYEAYDRTRDEVVAVKTLLHARPAHMYRLKREFRSLVDIAHTNLVSFYELIVEGAHCFFTMELVPGVNLVEYVRASVSPTSPLDPDRVRRVFSQLVDGIEALHRRGKLHRDIKPSNVLVTPAGRVVILDFGLASDLVVDGTAIGGSMDGTPAYLAPERCAGEAPSEKHDWYSVGVTLYQALTGHVPSAGPFEEGLPEDERWSAEIAPGVPDDLKSICRGLLRRDPAQRLSGRQAIAMLVSDSVASAEVWSDAEVEPAFVGRRRYLNSLATCWDSVRDGGAIAAYVHGPPGIGKSALVQHFVDDVSRRENVLVLRGRCHEHESVPYKAIDGIIDSLSQHLSALPRPRVESLLPVDASALSRLFPVMLQIAGVALARLREDDGHAEPVMLRQRAFAALRELLSRVAARQPLIVWIDDLHWADADSIVLLEELVRPPQAPAMLTIACFRTEEIASISFLQTLLERAGSKTTMTLALEPLTDDEARTLLSSVASASMQLSERKFVEIAHEAQGNPFLLRQLAGYLATHEMTPHRETFAEMMENRLRGLPPPPRLFIETLALCGRPMAGDVVHQAAGLDGDERPVIARLRASQFLRTTGSAALIEPYHDRIREAIAASVTIDRRRRVHASIAHTLIKRGANDPEALFEHFREADEHVAASRYAVLAAAKANAALAFDRAAGYYSAALALVPAAPARQEWSERLAAALANAGRPVDAADAYLNAAAGAHATRQVEFQRLAAEQLLIGGHIDRGLEVIRTVLRAVGLRVGRGPRTALASLLWNRARLRWRRRASVAREADRVPSAALLRVDTCWSVFTGFAMVDYARAAAFEARHLRLALDIGEPYRMARALAAEALALGSRGGAHHGDASACAARAEAAAARCGHPHAIALCTFARGASAFLVGEWPLAEIYCDRALDILRSQSTGTIWESNSAQVFRLGALLYQGKLRQCASELPGLLAAAKERGNLYFETELRTRMNLVWLAADEPDEGEREANEALRHWSHAGFHRIHYNYMVDRIQTELYRGRARAAWQTIADNWTALERTFLLRSVQFQRVEAWYLRARCALLMSATEANARPFLSIARADARRIAREKMSWSDPLSSLLTATIAYLEGQSNVARDKLTEAASGFERMHMKLYAAIARRRIDELTCDELSREGRRQADEWMAGQGVVDATRLTRLITPGFPDAS